MLTYYATLLARGFSPTCPQPDMSPRAVKTITIDSDTLARIEEFAICFHISVAEAINKALREWMDGTGDMMMAFAENERRTTSPPKLILVKRPG